MTGNTLRKQQSSLVPTPHDIDQASEAFGYFSDFIKRHPFAPNSVAELKIVDTSELSGSVKIPGVVLNMVADILRQMAQGNVVTLIPSHKQLTTQEAAGMLNVSRPYLIKLLEENKIQYTLVGRHRRIQFDDLMKYKETMRVQAEEAVETLILQSQEMSLY